jgi:hypothetical protein
MGRTPHRLRPLTKQHKDLIKPPAVPLERTNIELRRLMAPWPFYRAEKLALAVEETSAREEARGCYPAAFEEFNPPFLRTAHPPGPTKPIEKELISLRPGPAAKSEVVAHSLARISHTIFA